MEKVNLWVKKSIAADTEVTLGQAIKASSLPVTLASDQENVDVAMAVLPDTAASDLSHIHAKVDLITACNTGAIVGAVSITGNLPDTTANDLSHIHAATDYVKTAVESINTKTQAIEVDDVEPATVTIDFEHHMVHDGVCYRTGGITGSLNANGTYVIHILTPVAKKIHLMQNYSGTDTFTAALYENPTIAGGGNGTSVASYNRDRNNGTAPTTLVFHTPTISGGVNGTQIDQIRLGANQVGGATRSNTEWILKADEDYLIILTANANSMYITWWLTWYAAAVVA